VLASIIEAIISEIPELNELTFPKAASRIAQWDLGGSGGGVDEWELVSTSPCFSSAPWCVVPGTQDHKLHPEGLGAHVPVAQHQHVLQLLPQFVVPRLPS